MLGGPRGPRSVWRTFVGFPQQPSISSQACPCWAPWSPRRRWGSPSPWWPPARSAGTSGSSPCTGRRSGRPSGTSRQTSGWSRCRTPASARYRPPPRCSSPGKNTARLRNDRGAKPGGPTYRSNPVSDNDMRTVALLGVRHVIGWFGENGVPAWGRNKDLYKRGIHSEEKLRTRSVLKKIHS